MTSSLTTRRIAARDGTSINFGVRENADGQTGNSCVALVHSLAMDHTFWQSTIDLLAPDVSVVAIDARGHGQSDKPAGPYTAAQMAGDLRDVLDALGWSKVVVGGASMGGCVALQFAIDHPDRTQGLALMGTTSWYGPEAPKEWAARADKARKDGLNALVEFQKTRWFGDAFRAAHQDIVKRSFDVFLRNDIDAYAATCQMLGSFDARAGLASIKVPTAVLVGEQDGAATPAMAQVLHEGIAGSTLEIVAGARHLLPLEVPDVAANALRSLLAKSNNG